MSRKRMVIYWVATLFVAVNALGAGMMDMLRIEPLFGILLRLGFPAYFATILGIWKVLGAAALLVPRYPLLKEWAYAGLFFDFTAALVAHAASGDGPSTYVGPLLSIVALVASWSLRPPSLRLTRALATA
jgi:hypothetical protein